jgi:hypothetical protein
MRSGGDLTDKQVDEFVRDGFVRIQGVVPPDVIAAGVKVLWSDLGQNTPTTPAPGPMR